MWIWMTLYAMGSPECDAIEHRAQQVLHAPHQRCLTVDLHRLHHQATDSGHGSCLQNVLRRHRLGAPNNRPIPLAALGLRDSFGVPNLRESEHFALRYGPDFNGTMGELDAMLTALERAWTLQVEEQGYPRPWSTDQYKLNVYIGDTGGGTPGDLGAWGYMWYDPDEYPMLVLQSDLSDVPWMQLTAVHELFHAVQDAFETLYYNDMGAWYFESTSTWMEGQVYPENPRSVEYLFGYAFAPEVPINFFEEDYTGVAEEFHQYGAFVLINWIEENHGGPHFVRETFERSEAGGDPLHTMDVQLAERGSSMAQAFFAFSADNAFWEYTIHDDLMGAMQNEEDYDSKRPTGHIDGVKRNSYEPKVHLPQTWGANYWTVDPTLAGSLEISLDADPADWQLALVTRSGDDIQHYSQHIPQGEGALVIDDLPPFDEAWLVVAAIDGNVWMTGREYDYRLKIKHRPAAEQMRACGCTSGPNGAGFIGGLLALLLVGRRRRFMVHADKM